MGIRTLPFQILTQGTTKDAPFHMLVGKHASGAGCPEP